MATEAALRYLIEVQDKDLKQLRKEVDSTNKAIGDGTEQASKKGGGAFKSLGKMALLGAGAAGVGALVVGIKSVAGAAAEAEKAEFRLEQAFDAAKVSAVDRAAAQEAVNSVSRKAALDDEDLSDVLAKLTRSTGDVTKAQEGMALAAEIARGRDISLEAAAKTVEKAMLGKATAFARLGVVVPEVTTHYDALKAQMENLRDRIGEAEGATKKQLEAQLEQIEGSAKAAKALDKQATSQSALQAAQEQFAGSSKAYGDTTAGAQEKLSVAFENLQEKIGKHVLPVLADLLIHFTNLVTWAERNWPTFQAKVEQGVAVAKRVFDELRPVIDAIVTTLRGVVTIVRGLIEGDWSMVWNGLKTVATGAVQLLLSTVLAIPTKLAGLARDLAAEALDKVKAELVELRTAATNRIGEMVASFTSLPGRAWAGIKGAWADLTEPFKGAFNGVRDWLRDNWKEALVVVLTGLPGALWVGLHSKWGKEFLDKFKEVFNGVRDWIGFGEDGLLGKIVGFWQSLPGKIGAAVRSGAGDVKDAIMGIFEPLPDAVEKLLGIKSPSTVFASIGRNIVEGLIGGLQAKAGDLRDAAFGLITSIPGRVGDLAGKINFGGGMSTLDMLLAVAQQMGWYVTSTNTGRHTAGSLHYQDRAIDIDDGGVAENMAVFAAILQMFGAGNIKELFFDPARFYVDNGQIHAGSIGGHGHHVHWAMEEGGVTTRELNARLHPGEAVLPLDSERGRRALAEALARALPGAGGPLVRIEHAEFRDDVSPELVGAAVSRALAVAR